MADVATTEDCNAPSQHVPNVLESTHQRVCGVALLHTSLDASLQSWTTLIGRHGSVLGWPVRNVENSAYMPGTSEKLPKLPEVQRGK